MILWMWHTALNLSLQKRHQEKPSSISLDSLGHQNHPIFCCTSWLILTAALQLLPLWGVPEQVLGCPAKALQFNFSRSTRKKKKSSHLLESWAANLLSLVAGSLKIINPVLLYICECKAACWGGQITLLKTRWKILSGETGDKSSLAEHFPQSISRFLGDFLSVSHSQNPA